MKSESLIQNLSFSFYTSSEIENLSVVEVNNPIAFDNLKNPKPKGLYDGKMGVSPYNRLGKCETCKNTENKCTGHLGHIKLVLPIYNLFLIKDIHKLL